MSDDKIIQFVKGYLTAGLRDVRREHRERLKVARTFALERQVKRSAFRLAGIAGLAHFDFFARRAAIWFVALLVLAMSAAYWHAQNYVVGLEETDSAILIDEMPMDVITDKGFDTWLKSPAAR